MFKALSLLQSTQMTERLMKTTVLTACIIFTLGFSELLSAATATGNLAISVVVLSRCVIKFVRVGVAPQSKCDDGTTATLKVSSEVSNSAVIRGDERGEEKPVVTLTY